MFVCAHLERLGELLNCLDEIEFMNKEPKILDSDKHVLRAASAEIDVFGPSRIGTLFGLPEEILLIDAAASRGFS